MTEGREPGNYHVRFGDDWYVAKFKASRLSADQVGWWYVAGRGAGRAFLSGEIDEIGTRILPPGEPDEAAGS